MLSYLFTTVLYTAENLTLHRIIRWAPAQTHHVTQIPNTGNKGDGFKWTLKSDESNNNQILYYFKFLIYYAISVLSPQGYLQIRDWKKYRNNGKDSGTILDIKANLRLVVKTPLSILYTNELHFILKYFHSSSTTDSHPWLVHKE